MVREGIREHESKADNTQTQQNERHFIPHTVLIQFIQAFHDISLHRINEIRAKRYPLV